jgi:hypothetical protein
LSNSVLFAKQVSTLHGHKMGDSNATTTTPKLAARTKLGSIPSLMILTDSTRNRIGSHLHSFSFLKNEATCDFGQGAVAMQVGMFSGCSIHSLCRTPAASSFSARFFSCVSPFTSSVTYLQKVLRVKTMINATTYNNITPSGRSKKVLNSG